jgi:GNAT superfamily N-acetyltransferase
MDTPSPPPATFEIRPPATSAELDLFFQVAAMQFLRDAPFGVVGADLRRFVEQAPGADPTHIRGAFRGEAYLGGYLIVERWFRIGRVQLRTGCIGFVVTRPDFRGQGVATALMNDATAYARANRYALLLLHGLTNFYEPFGFVDIFDPTEYCFDRAEVLRHPASPCKVRPASATDAEAMLFLYDRHFGSHSGAFARTVAQQTYLLEFSSSLDGTSYLTREGVPNTLPVVAVDAAGNVQGYLFTAWGPLRAFGNEVAANDWPATLALLQFDARRLGDLPDPPREMRWPLPPDGLTAMLLSDRFAVRAETLHQPRGDAMAALVDPMQLLGAFRPVWEERLRHKAKGGLDGLDIAIDDRAVIRLQSSGQGNGTMVQRMTLPAKVLLPLIFGFRNARWAVAQDGVSVPDALTSVLDELFPPLQPWIPATDGC